MKTSSLMPGDIEVLVIEVTGTYVGGMGGPDGAQKPGYMLLGAVAAGPDANWFFKLTGPQATVETQIEQLLEVRRADPERYPIQRLLHRLSKRLG